MASKVNAADKLVHCLRGVLMENTEQRSPQQAGGNGADILDPVQNNAAENRFLQQRGKNGDHEENADQSAPLHRRESRRRKFVPEQPQKSDKGIVDKIEAEHQPEQEHYADNVILGMRRPAPAEGGRLFPIDQSKSENDRDIHKLIQKIGKVSVSVCLRDLANRHVQRFRKHGDGDGKGERNDEHSYDRPRIDHTAHRFARLIENTALYGRTAPFGAKIFLFHTKYYTEIFLIRKQNSFAFRDFLL